MKVQRSTSGNRVHVAPISIKYEYEGITGVVHMRELDPDVQDDP